MTMPEPLYDEIDLGDRRADHWLAQAAVSDRVTWLKKDGERVSVMIPFATAQAVTQALEPVFKNAVQAIAAVLGIPR